MGRGPKQPGRKDTGGRTVLQPVGNGALVSRAVLCFALIAGLAVVDYFTGYELGFFVFYFVPIALAAWTGAWPLGLGAPLLCGVAWMWADVEAGHPYSSRYIIYWNGLIRFGAFASIGVLVLRARWQVDKEFALNNALQLALGRELKELKGLLPICSSCKKIRDERGAWQAVEIYIRDRSHAEFSHGICPECVQRLYPDLAERLLEGLKERP